jgi:hypothetical protein
MLKQFYDAPPWIQAVTLIWYALVVISLHYGWEAVVSIASRGN